MIRSALEENLEDKQLIETILNCLDKKRELKDITKLKVYKTED